MSVKLTTREKGDVIIVDVSGRLTLGESSYLSASDCVAIFARCMGTMGISLSPGAHAHP
ncbi:MAG TPA: hypothetical protein VKO18_17445 [Terriglobia bacterium]|nr:hypothetical protein [Terriglobia bacterium]